MNIHKIISFFIIVISCTNSAVAQTSMSEALVKMRASFARTAISHFHAMPLFIRQDVRVGEVIRVGDEQRIIAQERCFEGIEVISENRSESLNMSLSGQTSLALGLGGEAEFYGIPASAEAEFRNNIIKTAQTIVNRTSRQSPGDVHVLNSPTGSDDICARLPPSLMNSAGPHILVSSVIIGNFTIKQSLQKDMAESIAANAELTPRGSRIVVNVNGDNSTDSNVLIHLNRQGSIAVQPAFINREELVRYFVISTRNPQSWAEFESLVNSYIDGSEIGNFEQIITRIRAAWQNLAGDVRLENYQERIFGSSGARFFPTISSLDLQEGTWSKIGTVAAAAEILTTER